MHEKQMSIADAYDRMPHDPDNCFVIAAYRSFRVQTMYQWFMMHAKNEVHAFPWVGAGQPYKNSAEMFEHIDNDRQLLFYTGGDLPNDHPLAAQSGLRRSGVNLTYNDIFRAVHDYYGHYLIRASFGPKGEEAAYQNHLQCYTGLARMALQTETQGQNSWFNYGEHLRIPRQNDTGAVYMDIPYVGTRGYLAPSLRPYAPQKANLIALYL